MAAILFGSIGTIADSSERQREAFNTAFSRHGLDWHWSRNQYARLLEQSGGIQRIQAFAERVGCTVDAAAIHRTKSEIFQTSLQRNPLAPRPGVVEVIQAAKSQGLKLAWVTTTSQANVDSTLAATNGAIQASDFDLVVNASMVQFPKPAADAYIFALRQLALAPENCIAIENNRDGVQAAQSAGLNCLAFPDENTASHDFTGAKLITRLNYAQLQAMFPIVA